MRRVSRLEQRLLALAQRRRNENWKAQTRLEPPPARGPPRYIRNGGSDGPGGILLRTRRKARSRLRARAQQEDRILYPPVSGTWAVLKFRCLLAVAMASLAAAVSAPPAPVAFRTFL